MNELNPNHPVTRKAHDNWHKVAALIMMKLGINEVVLTLEDINSLGTRPGGTNIAMKDADGVLRIFLCTDEEGQRLARQEGGIPSQS